MRSILGRPSQYRCNVRTFILGIETSCDDTGVAVIDQSGERIEKYSGHMIYVDQSGRLLSERIHSQASVRMGGVIPTFAMHSHASVIHSLVTESKPALRSSCYQQTRSLRQELSRITKLYLEL